MESTPQESSLKNAMEIYGRIDKTNGRPSEEGMRAIAKQINKKLKGDKTCGF